jgi:arginyl-tRNA synthetase
MLIHYIKQHNIVVSPLDSRDVAAQDDAITSKANPRIVRTIKELSDIYKLAHLEFTKNENDYQFHAKNEVVALQHYNKENIAIWNSICQISSNEFNRIYKLLNISDDLMTKGESTYQDLLSGIVNECLERNIAERDSSGAVVVPVESNGSDADKGDGNALVLQKSDGGYLYATTDIAALRNRCVTEQCDRVIYVVDSSQCGHFNSIFKTCRRMQYLSEKCEVSYILRHLLL